MLAALFAIGGLFLSPLFALPFALGAMLHRLTHCRTPASGILAATGYLRELTTGYCTPTFGASLALRHARIDRENQRNTDA